MFHVEHFAEKAFKAPKLCYTKHSGKQKKLPLKS